MIGRPGEPLTLEAIAAWLMLHDYPGMVWFHPTDWLAMARLVPDQIRRDVLGPYIILMGAALRPKTPPEPRRILDVSGERLTEDRW